MKRGVLSLAIVVAMVVAFWISPGVYATGLGVAWALLLGSLPALCVAGLCRVFVPRRAWRLLVAPLLSGAAYLSLLKWWAETMPPEETWGPDWSSALMGWLIGAVVVVLLELALGTPERFLRISHDQHP